MNSSKTYEPFVSIAMTTYNSGPYLREMVDSLLNQTYKNFELVVSDDASKDDTVAMLNDYAARDKRVKWSPNPSPAGCAMNFERAVSLCKGEIIFLCDSDDVWHPEKLALHVEAYKDTKVGWVYNKSVLTDINNKEIGYIEQTIPDYYTRKRSMLENAWGSCIGGAHASFRASLIKKLVPWGKEAGPHDPYIQLAIWPAKGVFIDKVLQDYRQHSKNDTGWSVTKITLSPEEFKKREDLSISNNLRLIKKLPTRPGIALWKRVFFLFVYIAKVIRIFLSGKRYILFPAHNNGNLTTSR